MIRAARTNICNPSSIYVKVDISLLHLESFCCTRGSVWQEGIWIWDFQKRFCPPGYNNDIANYSLCIDHIAEYAVSACCVQLRKCVSPSAKQMNWLHICFENSTFATFVTLRPMKTPCTSCKFVLFFFQKENSCYICHHPSCRRLKAVS